MGYFWICWCCLGSLLNQDFLANNDLVSFLKFKTSYGIMGDEAQTDVDGNPIYYPGYDTFSINNLNDEIFFLL